ncbi:hypothetical protein MHU86_17695 [Fragilaria crotonensis]|nr:hypothetical protein MHU86_17695 [Fragilaria crotonensis]
MFKIDFDHVDFAVAVRNAKDGHGVSGVHIVYEAYAENTDVGEADEEVLYPDIAALSPEENNETIDNVFAHRELSTIADSGMTVRIYNSTFMDIHTYEFQATYNTGNLYMFNVSMKNIQAGVLNNIMTGNATIESCTFETIDSVSLIRAVRSRMIEIRDTKFLDNSGSGMVTAIKSNVTISNCQFVRTRAPRGGEVLAFASSVELNDSCIIDSTTMTPVFRSSTSRLLTHNVFGQDIVGDLCPGILVEDEGSSCFSGGNCTGQCILLTGSKCGEASVASSLLTLTTWGFLAGATALVYLFFE